MWPFTKKSISPFVSSEGLAIIIVDMQLKFLENHDPLETERIVAGQLRLIKQASEHNIPVVNVRYQDRGDVHPEVFQAWLGLANKAPVLKDWNDAFSDTPMHRYLADVGVNNLIIAGINASFCVLATVDSAMDLDYRVHVADDLMADQACYKDKDKSRDWYRRHGVIFHESPITIVTPELQQKTL